MEREPLAALANAVEARLNCDYNLWGFEAPGVDIACYSVHHGLKYWEYGFDVCPSHQYIAGQRGNLPQKPKTVKAGFNRSKEVGHLILELEDWQLVAMRGEVSI